MEPTREDVRQLVVALFTVFAGMDRARRKQRSANTLALLQIAAGGGARPSEIASRLGVHQSSVTRQVAVLHEAGQVTVSPDTDDGRACVVALTDAGRDELTRLTEVGMDRFASFVAGWDAEDVRSLSRLLTRFEYSKQAATEDTNGPPTAARWRGPPS